VTIACERAAEIADLNHRIRNSLSLADAAIPLLNEQLHALAEMGIDRKTAGHSTKDKSFGRDNSSGRNRWVVHEAVPFVENRPNSWAVRAFHGGRSGAVCDQAAAIRLAFGPIAA
jgi:hypothetical protein